MLIMMVRFLSVIVVRGSDERIVVDTLDHFQVPFFGRLANSFVDDE
jgi:hypothetical protein